MATSLSSLWHHVIGHSVVCFVVISLVLKDFSTADSVFYREQVIQSQNAVLYFLLLYLPLLLVLFRGVINCCCFCASTQSYRFSITKALYQRTWYQRKDFFPFTDKRKCLYFQNSQRPSQLAVKTKKSILGFLFTMCGLKRLKSGETIYLKSRFPEQAKKPFQFI